MAITQAELRARAAALDLLASCRELREALAGSMRVRAQYAQYDGVTDAFIAEKTRIDRISERADAAIKKAEGA